MRMILISHGEFSKGALHAATMIIGECDKVTALGLMPNMSCEDLTAKIVDEIKKYDEGEEVLILSDLYFGSPFTAAAPVMSEYGAYHITGMNLPMIIEATTMIQNGAGLKEVVDTIIGSGKDGVIDVTASLAM